VRRVLVPGGQRVFTTWDTLDRHGFERVLMDGVRREFPDDPPLSRRG
jgi:hypothetical protein